MPYVLPWFCAATLIAGSSISLGAMDLPSGGASPLPTSAAGTAWLGYSNDNIGAPRYDQGDDFRTNRLWAGYQPTSWLRLGIDHSILTDGNPSRQTPDWSAADPFIRYRSGARRSDQLAIDAVFVVPFAADAISGECWIGPGIRHSGNVAGESLQQGAHGVFSLQPVSIPYDDPRAPWEPIAVGGFDVRFGSGPHLWWRTAATSGPAAPLLADTSLRLLLSGAQTDWWIGPGWHYRDERNSQVTRAVADHESGAWLAAGCTTGPLVLSISHRLDGDGALGSAGLVLGRDARPSASTPRARGELGTAFTWRKNPGKAVLGAVLIDLPDSPHLAWGIELRRTQLKVPYHFDHRAESDEALLIGEWSRGAPTHGLDIDPFLRAGAGWYQGRVRRTNGLPVTDDTTLDTLRTRIAPGVRGWWVGDSWSLALGIDLEWSWSPASRTIAYDLPARGITAPVGGGAPDQRIELGGNGLSSSLRAVVGLAW